MENLIKNHAPILILIAIVAAAVFLKAVVTRGKGVLEGAIGIGTGFAGALILGGIAHLGQGAPELLGLSTLFSTADAWTAACAAFGALFGDRIAVGVMVEADRFKKDPSAWKRRWTLRGERKGDD